MTSNALFLLLIVLLVILAGLTLAVLIKRRRTMGCTWCNPAGKKLAIKDKELNCHHCGANNFQKNEGLINTSFALLMNMGFLNKSAACYTCVECGCVHWFLNPKEKAYKEFDKDEL